jgi:predicted ATPase/class 3 adenylate cyclase
MSDNALQIAKLRAALAEIFARRDQFSSETYTQIIIALYDKIRALQTERQPQQAHLEGGDEIRLITILFVDVVDSTGMTQSLEADDWKATIGAAHSQVARLVNEWGGVVGQYLGDGLLCFFGTLHSREDDALRAVYCAQAIHATIAQFAQEIYARYDLRFNVRIGISTGRAVVGYFGSDDNKTLLALGAPTNLANRLQGMAAAGETLIDAQTYRRVRNHFVTEERPPVDLKGFDTPIEYYRVLRQREHRPTQLTTTAIAKMETQFVGRAAEIQAIKQTIRHSQQSAQCAAITIYGDIGLGKSRLLQEILDDLPNVRQVVMLGSYARRQSSYSLLQDLLAVRCNLRDNLPQEIIEERIIDHFLETWDHPDAESVAHVIGFLAGYGFNDSPHIRSLQKGSVDQKHAANAIIARWFASMARDTTLIIAVDNLQWVDAESLGLLEYLAYEMADMPVVILGAARPEFRDLAPQYLQQYTAHLELELQPLADADIDQMVRSVFQHIDQAPDTLYELIRSRAEGNPLFVEEFIYMLFDNGIIENHHDRWRINRLQYSTRSSKLPGGLVAILQARLDELPPRARQVIQMAAAVGTNFWPGALAQLIVREEIELALDDLQARGMILRRSESDFDHEAEYQFRHTLYRDVVYSMLTRQNREIYHRHIAAWMQERVVTRPEYLETLAEHYLRGHQHQEALSTYVQAARDRYQRGLLAETLSLIERGLDAARGVPREAALRSVGVLWMLQGQTLDALDRYEESSAASQTALMLLEELVESEMLEEKAIAARSLGSALLNLGRYDEAFDALNRANSLLPKDNIRQHAAVLRTFGMLFRGRGQLNESLAYQQQAFTLAQQSGDTREMARVMAVLSSIALERGDFATALAYCERVLEINRLDDNTYYQILDLRQMATIYRSLFAYEKTLELCDEAEPLQERIRYHDPLLITNRAFSLIALGQTEAGIRLARRVAEAEYQNLMTRHTVALAYVIALSMTGDYEQCRQRAARLAEACRHDNVILYGRARLWQGIAHNALNDQRALLLLQEALQYELRYGGRYAWLCYYALGNADPPTAAHWYEQAVNVLLATATSLHTRPMLQQSLLSNPIVRWLDNQVSAAR